MSLSDCPFCRKLADLDALPPEEVVCAFPTPWPFSERGSITRAIVS